MNITILGSGTSHGVPPIDCIISDYATCPRGVCQKAQADPRHRRTRASILVESADRTWLIDTSQDMRQQMLANRVRRVDAVLYSHCHADHTFGLPDIRSYCHRQGQAIDIYGSQETLNELHASFGYVFRPTGFVGGGIPSLAPHLLEDGMSADGLRIEALPVQHGGLQGCQGYRMGGLAYIPDAKVIPQETLDRLHGLDLLIINCLRLRPHPAHLCLEESLAYAQQVAPRRCLLTHMTHDIDYEIDSALLPEWAAFAYDGQQIEVP
ncbi:MAG: MBL fold metallo-hydrolase [Chloroflexi bacterium]|mgnify:CR=1 FL=1|nr:MBL fold metallo-hydrolase [Chloroflexota bacterium]